MGLGPLALYSLKEAREKALEMRRLRHEGIDPIEARRAARTKAQVDAAKAITFKQCAEAFIKAHRVGWRNAKHAAQWEATLATYAEPIIGALPVQAIDTALVMNVLEQEVADAPGQPVGSPLDGEARDSKSIAWTHRSHPRLGQGAQPPRRRESRALARPSRQTAASSCQSAQSRTPCGASL